MPPVHPPSTTPRRSRNRGRVRRGLLAAIATFVVVASLTSCDPNVDRHRYEQLVHRTSLPEFVGWWQSEHAAVTGRSVSTVRVYWDTRPSSLDVSWAKTGPWDMSTDFCSNSPDTGWYFDFRAACARHDFAWRNLKHMDRRWGTSFDNRTERLRANERFRLDMLADCARRSGSSRTLCTGTASAYHRAVNLVA